VSAPPAEGARIAWQDVPGPVRAAIEQVCGAPVTEARDKPGGFSPGMAARVRCADGTEWFVKAASAEVNPHTPRLHRQEANVLAGLDPLIAAGRLPVPRLHGTAESGPWFALVVEDVAGRQPALPWRDGELGAVLAALDRMTATLTPAPVTVPAISEYLGTDFTGWRALSRAPSDDRIDPWSRARLPELAALEATWAARAAGETLLHADLRADEPSARRRSRLSSARWPAISPNARCSRHRPGCPRCAVSRPRKARLPAAGWPRCCDLTVLAE
jgi:hypothetical protein